MQKLIRILKLHEVEPHELAEMVYFYLYHHGEDTDKELMDELFAAYLTKEEA
ncbi:hypothetical protein [Peribacillus loiseleuriae]|uniref:hypothetical protein n=1 Tax=Peribacillus loiseleuriae TaxID=1679170 RepID=UPI000A5CE8B6|nr:hypothetical protein [Peribacillus loiseleuriae]